MPSRGKDSRLPIGVALQLASQITTIGMEMAIPAGLGYLGDERWGTLPWLTVLGAVFGFSVGFWHLLRLVGNSEEGRGGQRKKSD